MKIDVKQFLLTSIIPIGNMNGNLDILRSWITQISNYSVRVVLVHDFKDEGTALELKKLVSENLGLEIIQISGSFGSPGAARNRAVSLVDSEWVAFWDCDDIPLLNNIFNAIDNSDDSVEILVGGFITRNIDGSITSKRHSKRPSTKSVSINPGVWRMVFKSRLVSNIRFEELMLAEDHLYLSKLKFATRRVKFISNPFYQYHIGSSSQLTNNPLALKDLIVASGKILDGLSDESSSEQTIFNLTLVFRQQITLLSRADYRLKLKSICLIASFFTKLNLRILKLSFISIKNLIVSARNSKLL